jgi:signal transduction histidine kinase
MTGMTRDGRHGPASYDSLLPDPAPGAPPAPAGEAPSVPDVDAAGIAVAVDDPELRTFTEDALRAASLAFSGPDHVGAASLVVVDAAADVATQIAALRARTRPDAAILLLLDPARPTSSATAADAFAAGAFACVRAPFVAEELLGLVRSALGPSAGEIELADLSRKLDLETHLASIGRVGAALTHEIANPLGVALTNLEVLREECDDVVAVLRDLTIAPPNLLAARIESARARLRSLDEDGGLGGMIREIAEAHDRLRALLDGMRGLVARSVQVRREPVDLLALAREVASSLGDDLAGVAVEVIGEAVVVEADRVLLGQIVQNLATNAVAAAKLLASPRVRLHAYARGDVGVISIRDNGPGIAAELHDRIFEPFYTTRRGKGGTCLGLALCREYAVRIGATLAVWSIPGRGTCFRVRLPLARRH